MGAARIWARVPRATSPPSPQLPTGEAHTYWVSFLEALTCLWCPVEGCQGGVDHMDQPLGSLFTLTCARFHYDPGGSHTAQPPLP